MNIKILSTNPNLYASQLLVEAATGKDIETIIIKYIERNV